MSSSDSKLTLSLHSYGREVAVSNDIKNSSLPPEDMQKILQKLSRIGQNLIRDAYNLRRGK